MVTKNDFSNFFNSKILKINDYLNMMKSESFREQLVNLINKKKIHLSQLLGNLERKVEDNIEIKEFKKSNILIQKRAKDIELEIKEITKSIDNTTKEFTKKSKNFRQTSKFMLEDFNKFIDEYTEILVEKVKALERRYGNVHAVVNTKDGPTSKGQILNHVIGQVLLKEKELDLKFDAFLMQDAEDIMHEKVLQLLNLKLDRFDFIQVPIFSLDVNSKQLVAGTYMDEFAEKHTKDILVREFFGAAIPSAGVGTGLSRQLVLALREREGELVFNEKSLAEDYEFCI